MAHQPRPARVSPSRRSLLSTASAAAITLSVGGPLVLADDKTADPPPILGAGAFKYECLHGWARLPDNMRLGNTHMVQEDAQGRIVVHHQGGSGAQTGSVCSFDATGKFIKAWGQKWSAGAHGLQLRKEAGAEYLYLATTGQSKIAKTTLDGDEVFVLDYPKDAVDTAGKPCYPGGKGYAPTNIALAPNGDFYVADGYGRSFVHQYNIKGEYIRTFGGPGSADGQLNCPHGIWIDTRDPANPLVLVADRANERLQWFTLDGKHARTLKPDGNAFRHPCHFDQRDGHLLLPGLHGRVSILDPHNTVVAILGDNPDAGQRGRNNVGPDQRKPGVFVSPHGACWDRAGNIYVTEWVADGRIMKLRHLA
ncbi:MAG: hypothetical protein ABSH20_23805 [Tepidisphaeraceae bacterium]|jgi:hypothetical protein